MDMAAGRTRCGCTLVNGHGHDSAPVMAKKERKREIRVAFAANADIESTGARADGQTIRSIDTYLYFTTHFEI